MSALLLKEGLQRNDLDLRYVGFRIPPDFVDGSYRTRKYGGSADGKTSYGGFWARVVVAPRKSSAASERTQFRQTTEANLIGERLRSNG